MAGITAIGGALVAANPTTQENLRIAANSLVEATAKTGENAAQSMKNSILIWDVIVGTAFPIHLLDPGNRSLVNPILTDIAVHPSSGGFGDGSVVAPTVHTGGTQLDGRQDDGKYVTPEHRLDPGNVFSENHGSGTEGNSATDDFFAGTKYTNKVLGQIKTGDLHAFPESVKVFQGAGEITKITGGDGVERDMLKIPGEYRGKQGVFEFIKEPDGSINHRLFKPN